MFGGTETLNSVTTRIFLTDLVVAGKESVGDWITVRWTRYSTKLTHSTLVVISERLLEQVKGCEIRSEVYGPSDHCPIVLEIADAFDEVDDVKNTSNASTKDTTEATNPSSFP